MIRTNLYQMFYKFSIPYIYWQFLVKVDMQYENQRQHLSPFPNIQNAKVMKQQMYQTQFQNMILVFFFCIMLFDPKLRNCRDE